MILKDSVKYALQDLAIVPEAVSAIRHRSQCSPYVSFCKKMYLPLITAPMESVVSQFNYKVFEDNDIISVIPRTKTNPIEVRMKLCSEVFCAFSLDEALNYFTTDSNIWTNKEIPDFNGCKICIDIANGHMQALIETVEKIKELFPNIIIMTGNIANPKAFFHLAEAGVDLVRVGIGTGSRCTTSSNSAVHYPLASLIEECYLSKVEHGYKTKIVADGGIGNFDDIITALALGADFCMCGNLFAKCIEAYGGKLVEYRRQDNSINRCFDHPIEYIRNKQLDIYKEFDLTRYKYCREYYGMSTKRAQELMGIPPEKMRTAEGISKYVDVEYTLAGWTENFRHYMRNAMSYTSSFTLDDFIGQVDLVVLSPTARAAYFK